MQTTIHMCGFKFKAELTGFGAGPGIDSRALGDYYRISEPVLVNSLEWDEHYPGENPTPQAMKAAIEENEDIFEQKARTAWMDQGY